MKHKGQSQGTEAQQTSFQKPVVNLIRSHLEYEQRQTKNQTIKKTTKKEKIFNTKQNPTVSPYVARVSEKYQRICADHHAVLKSGNMC